MFPEEKQCHSLLSKVMRKNGVEVLSLVEKKIDYYYVKKTMYNRLEVIWLVNVFFVYHLIILMTEKPVFYPPFTLQNLSSFC